MVYYQDMNNATAIEIINTYTENMLAAEPKISTEELNIAVAAAFTNYLAHAVDPGTYAYHPHPYNEAEAILHNAHAYLLTAAANAAAVPALEGGLA